MPANQVTSEGLYVKFVGKLEVNLKVVIGS
jgi:hypothetical protein